MKRYKFVALERRGKFFLGLILKEAEDAFEIYLEAGEKVNIPSSKIIYTFKISLEADNEKNMKLVLKSARENFSKESVDLSVIWECLSEENVSFSDLLNLYFGNYTDTQAGSLFLALENTYYFEYKNGYFYKVSAKLVETNIKREVSEKQSRSLENLIIEWFKGENEQFVTENPEEYKKTIEHLKLYALEGEENASSEAKRLAGLLESSPDEMLIWLEQKGILEKDINETIYRSNLTIEHSKDVINESKEILSKDLDIKERRVIKDCWSIAIDDIETEEVDDAISYWIENDLHVIGVHIVDASYTITKDSHLDQFASNRFATIYFTDQKYYLFPFELIKNKMTFAVNSNRASISGFFYFDKNWNLVKNHFEETIFCLAKRSTYEETKNNSEPEFLKLKDLSSKLKEERIKNGAVITNTPEVKIKVENGEVDLKLIYPTIGHTIVSELMILFNSYFAKEFASRNIPAFFRVQNRPSEPINIVEDDPLNSLKIRWKLGGASVTLNPGLHFTLGLNAYVQATSPMRRYSDLIMHRSLIAILHGKEQPYTTDELYSMKSKFERMEKTIKIAEHNRYMFWLMKYFKKNKGTVYEGFVSRILDNNRPMVFIPDFLQEFPWKEELNLSVGKMLLLKVQGASPRKKRVHFDRVYNKNEI